jgi:hypothetical protein
VSAPRTHTGRLKVDMDPGREQEEEEQLGPSSSSSSLPQPLIAEVTGVVLCQLASMLYQIPACQRCGCVSLTHSLTLSQVGPGELLYLPALWYHRVSQACTQPQHDYVVAVNFWVSKGQMWQSL